MKRELIVMAKAPLIGYAKSRLIESSASPAEARGATSSLVGHSALEGARGIGSFDAARVARLADAFIRDTLRGCERCTREAFSIVFAPPNSEDYFRMVAPDARLVPQADGDLGARVAAAVALAFDGGATRVVVIGTDAPHMSPARIDEAFAALSEADCVLGPAHDGGYYLIGLTAHRPELFRGIDWGTASVLAETVATAVAHGLRITCLREERDIDERADLEWLAEELRSAPGRCPGTASVLGESSRR